MKNPNSYPADPDKDPEKTGSLENTKKRKKKAAKKAARVTKLIEKTEATEPSTVKSNKKESEAINKDEVEQTTESEVYEKKPEVEYSGELIIDHSEAEAESLEPEDLIGHEQLAADLPESDISVNEEIDELSKPRIANQEVNVENIISEKSTPSTVVEQLTAPAGMFEFLPEKPELGSFDTMIDPNIMAIKVKEKHTPTIDSENMVTEEEANNRAYKAEKRGLSRGVVSGALAGWWFGRRGKRAAQKEASITISQKDEIIKQLTAERNTHKNMSEKRLGVIERTQEEFRLFMERRRKPVSSEATNVKITQNKPEKTEKVAIPESASPVFETGNSKTSEVEKSKTTPIEEQTITEETYQAPAGKRFESSAWHRIEIDNKTGKLSENPSLAYGEAFTREQRQEKLAREAATAQTASQVGMTLLASGAFSSGGSVSTSSLDDMTSPPSGDQSTKDSNFQQEFIYIGRQIAKRTTNPMTWLIAFAFVVLLFVLGIL